MSEDKLKVGRLCMRKEGGNWCGYYALPDTMEGAVMIGAIAVRAVDNNLERKQAFMDLMRDVVADIIEEGTGQRPTWGGIENAPEHERSGEA